MARRYGIPVPLHEPVYDALSMRAEHFMREADPFKFGSLF
jgi:hypothetical protein